MKKRNEIPVGKLKAKSYKLKAGFSLVEMLLYVAILSLVLLAVTQTLIVATRAAGALRAARAIGADAALSLERMTREIRGAEGLSDAGSVFSAHPGKLLLATTDAAGGARTVEFSLSGGQLLLRENGVTAGALTGAKTEVTNLVFRKIQTARSQGVKVELALRSGAGAAARSERFYATVALRDSY